MECCVTLCIENPQFFCKLVVLFQVRLGQVDLVDSHIGFRNLNVCFHLLSFSFGVCLLTAYFKILFLILDTGFEIFLLRVQETHFIADAAFGFLISNFF